MLAGFQTHRLSSLLLAASLTVVVAGRCHGQNDWQYPDPYFGILEIEKSRVPAGRQQPRDETSQGFKASRKAPAPPGAPRWRFPLRRRPAFTARPAGQS
jgi:hypothetical protein